MDDDKIKNILGSLDDQERATAQEAKERIWSKVQPAKEKKKGNQWWLLLLLGGLLFSAGWLLNPDQGEVMESAPPLQEKKPMKKSPDVDLQFALNQTNSMLKKQQKTLDSLRALNVALSNRMLTMNQNNTPIQVQPLAKAPSVIRDTIYLTQVKVEERLIEKVIKDTVFVELPGVKPLQAPTAELSENLLEANMEETPDTKTVPLPSSVQFNFSETNQIDN